MIVRKLRLQRGWSQDQLAELMDVSVRTVTAARARAEAQPGDRAVIGGRVRGGYLVIHRGGNGTPEKAELQHDEKEALEYVKGVKEFIQGLGAYVVMAIVFFAVMGFDRPVLWWVFLGIGAGLAIQALFTFEIIRLPFQDWEKRMAERKLGRKL